MKNKFNIYKFLYFSIILYTISTMIQEIIESIPLNRIAYFFIIICIVGITIKKIEKISFIYLSLVIIDMILVHLIYNISENVLDYIYFLSTLFWLIFMFNDKRREKLLNEINNHFVINKIIIFISVLLTIIALITKIGYKYSWGSMYFVGFSGLAHTAASSLCLVCTLILLTYSEKKFSWKILTTLMIMVYAIFETGARTFIIPALIIIYLYISKCYGIKKVKFLIYAVGITIAIIVFAKSNIMDKFNFTNNIDKNSNMNLITQQTSGRSEFWLIDIKGFLDGSLFDKFFGHGHGYTYYLNERYYNLRVWAHNDFIQILVGAGVITLYIYIKVLYISIKEVTKNTNFIDKFLLILYCLFPAIFNGFFNYPHYFLSFILLCLLYENLKRRNDEIIVKK